MTRPNLRTRHLGDLNLTGAYMLHNLLHASFSPVMNTLDSKWLLDDQRPIVPSQTAV
jgi:hypothetical protein